LNKDKLEPFQVARYSVGVFYEVATKALAQTKFPHVFGSDVVIEQHSAQRDQSYKITYRRLIFTVLISEPRQIWTI
jgi:hypothetical protein